MLKIGEGNGFLTNGQNRLVLGVDRCGGAAKSMQATAVAFNGLFNRFFIFRLILSQAVIEPRVMVTSGGFFDTGSGHAHELRALQRGNVRAPQ